MLRSIVLTFALLLALPAAAQAPRFSALCTHEGGQRVDASERNRRSVWSGEEKYDPKPWVVQFNGADKLTVDGEEFLATARSASTVMGVLWNRAPGADNVKVWVLNIGFGRGFFSHLQGIDLLGERIVGKLHEFRCQVTKY